MDKDKINPSLHNNQSNFKENNLSSDVDKMKPITDNNEKNSDVSNNTDSQKRVSVSVIKTSSNENKKDVYMIAEGYHKTDSCYYKTIDGGYHKLPPDSYHKMSEICYKKLADGTFKRLVDMQNEDYNIPGVANATSTSTHNKVRTNMIKFLKRSKSHSQATAKENYLPCRKEVRPNKEKEMGNRRHNILKGDGITTQPIISPDQNNIENKNTIHNKRHSTHSNDRKVVVTMMENGGLPIVATSKIKTPKVENKSHHQSSIREKVK